MKISKASLIITIAAASSLMLSSCASGESADTVDPAPEAETIEQLYEAAKVEGEVVVYGPATTLNEPVYRKFEKAYPGITVTSVAMFGPELDARIEAEQVTGSPGDLLQIGTPDQERYREMGVFEPLTPFEADQLPEGIVDSEKGWVVPSKILFGVVYNTDRMDAADVPASWAELTDPSLKGKVTSSDPTVRGAAANLMAGALAAGVIDDEWLTDWKNNVEPRIFPSSAEAANGVISGEFQVQMGAVFGQFANAKANGAPIGFGILKDGVFEELSPYTLFKGAKNPNAARLLVTWLLTDEGQQAIADINFQPAMPDAPQPEWQPSMEGVQVRDWATQEQLTETMEALSQLLR